nr:MAG TPA: hypothetical protein [Caudoviricetes sp.]
MQASNLQSWTWQDLNRTFKSYHAVVLKYQDLVDELAVNPDTDVTVVKEILDTGDRAIRQSIACWNEMVRRRNLVGFCG